MNTNHSGDITPNNITPKDINNNQDITPHNTSHQSITPEDPELHELQARKNALEIALRQSDPQTIAYLECAVQAIIKTLSAQQKREVLSDITHATDVIDNAYDTVNFKTLDIMRDAPEKSKRQVWREELAKLRG